MKPLNTLIVTACLFTSIFAAPWIVNGQNQNVKVEDFGVIPILKNFEPPLITFEIMDQKSINSQYSVMIIHAQSERISHGTEDWDSIKRAEVFGVFIIEQAKLQPVTTVDIFYTRRLFDYEVEIHELGEDHLTVVGHGMTYGDQPLNIKYFFNLKENKLLKKVEFNPLCLQSIMAYHDTIFFLGFNAQNSILLVLCSPHNYSNINQYQVIDQVKGKPIPKLHGFNNIEDNLYLEGETTNYVFFDNTWKVISKPPRSGLQAGENYLIRPDGYTIIKDHDTTFYHAPYWNYELLNKYRPGETKYWTEEFYDPAEENKNYSTEIVSSLLVGNKLWFGTTFYNGEGATGVGGIGYFDLESQEYQMYYPKEIVEWSTTAIYANEKVVLVGLMHFPEGAEIPEGLAKFDITTQQVTTYPIPEIITSIYEYGNIYFIGTCNGIYVVDGNNILRIGIIFDINNKYFVYLESQ